MMQKLLYYICMTIIWNCEQKSRKWRYWVILTSYLYARNNYEKAISILTWFIINLAAYKVTKLNVSLVNVVILYYHMKITWGFTWTVQNHTINENSIRKQQLHVFNSYHMSFLYEQCSIVFARILRFQCFFRVSDVPVQSSKEAW